ncbi:unnamed protein product [Linum tenue]|uniref:Uncharacterized protein n=1 Tax=Linum tenue TaxID=586396 RepID=A0AAV0S9L3_9ROSI|nr:unnamed protein product [Linum tenue]
MFTTSTLLRIPTARTQSTAPRMEFTRKDVALTVSTCRGATMTTCTWWPRRTRPPCLQLHCSSSDTTRSTVSIGGSNRSRSLCCL